MTALVIVVVSIIICLQIYFYRSNKKKMKEFKRIFSADPELNYFITRTSDGLVNGIGGDGNNIFKNIKDAINKYLGNNTGSVIDFQLLKDAVDRNCETIEEDINAQTPVPLYCGLAGTMIGVVVGLASLLLSNGLTNMMGGGSNPIEVGNTITISSNAINSGKISQCEIYRSNERKDSFSVDIKYDNKVHDYQLSYSELQQAKANAASVTAAKGVNDLLLGVAIAMIASVCGIIFTTLNSLYFKKYKQREEKGKNSFLAWMQSKLLPELPSDTSHVMQNMVKGLNRFNTEFTKNVTTLSSTFDKVNESYRVQADIIQTVHDMDVTSMAKANVKVWRELQESTEKIERFNDYLSKLDEFNEQFAKQADTQEIFKKIADYFDRSKAYLSTDVDSTDEALHNALQSLNTNSTEEINELKDRMTEMSTDFQYLLKKEKEDFEIFTKELHSLFEASMENTPTIAKKLEEISQIPDTIDKLIQGIYKSNAQLTGSIETSINKALSSQSDYDHGYKSNAYGANRNIASDRHKWISYLMTLLLFIIAVCLAVNTYFSVSSYLEKNSVSSQNPNYEYVDSTQNYSVDSTRNIQERNSTQSGKKQQSKRMNGNKNSIRVSDPDYNNRP